MVETDASDFVSAAVLSQYDDNGILHPVAYFSKKHSPPECNYEIYDKELMAIVRAFEEWRAELQSVENPITVLTDHKNLEYFTTTKLLNRRQARWAQFLSQFNFRIIYRPGKSGAKPDSLTRRSGDLPKEGDERLTENFHAVIKPHQILRLDCHATGAANNADADADAEADADADAEADANANANADANAKGHAEPGTEAANTKITELFAEAYKWDPFPDKILDMLRRQVRYCKDITLSECTEDHSTGKLLYRGKFYVPAHGPLRLYLIQTHHEVPAAGHPGRSKTLELLSRNYYWPKMRRDVERFVRNCHTCQRSRTSRHAPFGVLRPLPIPQQPWQDISMDFVTGLPWSNGHDAVWVVVDRLTKQRHLVPCRTTVDARDLADLFLQNVFRLHGLPLTVTSDRGPQFASAFWHRLCARLGVEPRLSTAFHPQTDGQTERMNAVMEQYLRSYVNYLQDDWSEWLPLAEFASNNHTSETTAVSPFFANLGYDPRWQFDLSAAAPRQPDDQRARSAVQALSEIHDHLRAEMHRAQLRHQENTDEHRIPAPDYQVGDLVWLDARNWKTRRPSAKLDHRRHGPFRIAARISPHAYRLELHDSMQVHPVFHVSLLEPAAQDPLPGQRQPPPPPVEIDGEEEWFVDSILDSRMYRRRLQYLVKWTGFDQPDWEPAENVNELEAVTLFHERFPHKPGPLGFAGAQR